VVLSLAEIDSAFHEGQVIVADTRGGQQLGKYGLFQLVVSGDRRARLGGCIISILYSSNRLNDRGEKVPKNKK
jgi:hypothetical protein